MGKGTVKSTAYGHTATFTENSKTVITDGGSFEMVGEVKRLNREQLYVPAEGFCRAFKMRYSYYDRNNILSFEHESEHDPVPFQP